MKVMPQTQLTGGGGTSRRRTKRQRYGDNDTPMISQRFRSSGGTPRPLSVPIAALPATEPSASS
jgi:hypothetical protein